MDKIRAGLPKLVKGLSPQGGRSAAEAILTTDTHAKEAALRVEVGGRPVTIGGIAKGVGMLEPHLATMFCFLATDAMVASDALAAVLRRAVDGSFNRVTVDGDQSTSDTVAVLANGLAENATLERGGKGLRQFARGLQAVTMRLARMLVADGEGATKVVEVVVRGARTRKDALIAARSVANSPLVKTAINGADPNWGRIMMALGKSTARVAAGPGGHRDRRRDARRARHAAARTCGSTGSARRWPGPSTPSRSTSASGGAKTACGHPTSPRSTFESTRSTRPSTHDVELRSPARSTARGSAGRIPPLDIGGQPKREESSWRR